MSEVSELSDSQKTFLGPYLPPATPRSTHDAITSTHGSQDQNNNAAPAGHSLPFVTLTYACSLDSMISLAPGLRTTLSGPETKSMTHYLRLRHDAILVGVGTAIPDDPGLNSRYPGATLETQPRPVVIDPGMRWDFQKSKLAQIAQRGGGKVPWLIHMPHVLDTEPLEEGAGRRIYIAGETTPQGHAQENSSRNRISWLTILKTLKAEGIESVMIEGGATVISALLNMPELINSVIVTIAPTWLGQGGVTVSPMSRTENGERINAARLQDTKWCQFGADAVLCGRLQP